MARKTKKTRSAASKKSAKKPTKTKRKPVDKAKTAKAATRKRTTAAKRTTKKAAPKRATQTAKKTSVKRKVESTKMAGMAPALDTFLLNGSTDKAMEQMMTQSTKQFGNLAQDASDIGREGFEAFIKSGTIFAKGFEDIVRTTMSLAQDAAEKQSQLAKEAMSSKTLNEWTEIQSKIAQANFDEFMSNATKISEMSVKVLTEASEPLNEQVTKTVNKASSMAA